MRNNPLTYIDPSGHAEIAGGGGGCGRNRECQERLAEALERNRLIYDPGASDMIARVASAHQVSASDAWRLSTDEIYFLGMYQELIASGEWEAWYNPAAYIRFASLDETLRSGRGNENWAGVHATIFVALGISVSPSDLGTSGEINIDALARKLGWAEEGRLKDGTRVNARDYNLYRRQRPFGSRINGFDRVYFRVNNQGVVEEVIIPESKATARASMGASRFTNSAGRSQAQIIDWMANSSRSAFRNLGQQLNVALKSGIPFSQPWVATTGQGRVAATLAQEMQLRGGAVFRGRVLQQVFGRIQIPPPSATHREE